MPSRRELKRTIASLRIGLAGTPQIAVLIQLRQFSQTLLHLLPSSDPLARGLLRSLGNIVAGGLALLPAVAHIQMRTMLGSIALTMTARSSAGAVSFRERSEMAISARRWISPSSLRRWAVESTDLTMAPPTGLIASDGKQILGNHTPAHVALKSRLSFVGGSRPREGMLQSADGSFHPGPPAQTSPEPALLLLLGPLGR